MAKNERNLMAASQEWATRPDDQRFASIEDMYKATLRHKNAALSSVVDLSDILVVPKDEDLMIVDKSSGGEARMTNWGFRQVCRWASAPASYMQQLPSRVAAECVNHGLSKNAQRRASGLVPEETNGVARSSSSETGISDEDLRSGDAKLMFHKGKEDRLTLRSMTGIGYSRIWNADIASKLMDLSQNHGWRVPPALPARPGQKGTRKATAEDVIQLSKAGLGIAEGDDIAPAGLYASDHDMFAFLVNEENRIDDGSEGGLGRGFFLRNSETGAGSLWISRFMYRFVCGNHIVWGASNIEEISIRHVGAADSRFGEEVIVALKKYADASGSKDRDLVLRAKSAILGANAQDVISKLLGLRVAGLSASTIESAYNSTRAYDGVDGDPNTAWGIAQGLTRISQESRFADQRIVLDRAAGRLLEKLTA